MKTFLPLAGGCAVLLSIGAASAQTRCGAAYTMQPGDTLYAVSQRCRVSLARILDLNPGIGDPSDIPVGRRLELDMRAETGDETDPDRPRQYRVEAGDTAYSIAQELGISLVELLAENEDLNPLAMAVGEALDIPTSEDGRGAGITIEPRAGAPGSEVVVRARGLVADDVVTVGAGRSASEWRAIREVRVASDGELQAEVAVPGWAEPGDILTFVVDTDRGLTLKSADFDVTRASDPDEGRAITLEGRVREGVECATLTTPDGDLWSIVSDDIGFTPGEYVRVEGTRAEMSFCQQGVGTVSVSEIREVPAPGDRPDDTRDLTDASVMGGWAVKGGNCARPEFDIRDGGRENPVVATALNGAPRTGIVRTGSEPALVFEQPYTELGLESRGEGELAVFGPAGTTLGGVDVAGDGAVFVRCG